MGLRVLIPAEVAAEAAADLGAALTDPSEYDAHRIALGVPRGGVDFIYGDVFPHDADLDKVNGVDFKKGCFIGQVVVSRVEHRGTARNRIVPVEFDAHAAEDGVAVTAGDKAVAQPGPPPAVALPIRCPQRPLASRSMLGPSPCFEPTPPYPPAAVQKD